MSRVKIKPASATFKVTLTVTEALLVTALLGATTGAPGYDLFDDLDNALIEAGFQDENNAAKDSAELSGDTISATAIIEASGYEA